MTKTLSASAAPRGCSGVVSIWPDAPRNAWPAGDRRGPRGAERRAAALADPGGDAPVRRPALRRIREHGDLHRACIISRSSTAMAAASSTTMNSSTACSAARLPGRAAGSGASVRAGAADGAMMPSAECLSKQTRSAYRRASLRNRICPERPQPRTVRTGILAPVRHLPSRWSRSQGVEESG